MLSTGGDSARAQDNGENQAKNPGFEEWPARPPEGFWGALQYSVGAEGREGALDGEAYRTGEGETDKERHSGDYAQFINTHTYGRGAISSGLPVLPGTRYRISVWAKVLSGELHLNVCFAHEPWSYIGDWTKGIANGEWTRYTKEVVIPDGCQSICAVMFLQYGAGYLDDLEIVDIGFAEDGAMPERASEPPATP